MNFQKWELFPAHPVEYSVGSAISIVYYKLLIDDTKKLKKSIIKSTIVIMSMAIKSLLTLLSSSLS